MENTNQQKTPLCDALKDYISEGIMPFHVPAHKQGRGLQELSDFIGQKALELDLTCVPGLDNICKPRGPIREAEQLAAEAYGADDAFFVVNGTTSAIQAMISSVCAPGEKIILPRNTHKSVTSGLILSGAIPVYINPEVCEEFGISTGIKPKKIKQALKKYPDARAVFLINPNYYGTAPELEESVAICHSYNVPVLVDEAHGAHFCFHPELPLSAVEAGADLVASSTHKLVGSMTQSSTLFINGDRVNPKRVKAVLNLTQTTSPSYLLLASLDIARKQIASEGRQLLDRTLHLTRWIRNRIKRLGGAKLLDQVEKIPGCVALDPTKIVLNVRNWGLSGFEAERILREDYKIQVEMADLYNIILLISISDNIRTVEYLWKSLENIPKRYPRKNVYRYCPPPPPIPEMCLSPREAFYAETEELRLQEAEGEISAETITAYPPGIPLICAGEKITREVIDYINILHREQVDLQGTEDPEGNNIKTVKRVAYTEMEKEEEILQVLKGEKLGN